MEKNNNTIRLTEQEFNTLVNEAVIQVLNEGKFGDLAKKVGKGVGKAALYGALGTGLLYGADKGLENMENYQQEGDRQTTILQGPSEEEISRWMEEHEMSDTPQNREVAWEFLNGKMQDVNGASTNESKQIDRISQIIREEISKVL